MSKEQIIIDGVDVHWCEHYTGNIGYLTDKNWTCRAKIQGTKCEDWSDCYFKRWQRKEQEYDRLNRWLPIVVRLEEQFGSFEKAKGIDYKTYAEQIFAELDQLKAENEDLENQLEREKERFEKQDKFAAMFIQELKNEKSSLVNEYLKKIGHLQSENKELKEKCKKYGEINEQETKDYAELKVENERLKTRGTPPLIGVVLTENKQLKQTLSEIKEIVQFSNRPYKLCGEYNDCCDVLNKIWNKINEVEDEDS